MSESGIPDGVSQFLRKHVQSVEHLEVLVLLQNEPNKVWGAAEVNQIIRSNEASIRSRLQDLARSGVLLTADAQRETFQFRADAPDAADLPKTIELYKTHRLAIIQAIYSPPSPVDEFAKAFRLRKNK